MLWMQGAKSRTPAIGMTGPARSPEEERHELERPDEAPHRRQRAALGGRGRNRPHLLDLADPHARDRQDMAARSTLEGICRRRHGPGRRARGEPPDRPDPNAERL